MRATTADIRRRVTTTTTVTRAARRRPEPFLDGAHQFDRARTQTHRVSLRRAYEEALQRRAAPRRPGPPYEYPGAYIPRHPSALRPRARPALVNAPRDDAWLSRRSQRRPQRTVSLYS
jgi:hypothetical protein